ncbi:DUF6893 family small protein [Streptomonospora litoralis]|uniref:Uncharacterized protein n=1 Tax=Streptomonospora litoralis TaxID=2498135 RepID=A0A4P6Q405_9ACTN|nr:hypothetical protein EKD16_08800 [Streptomonospora litoralis]
MKWWMVALVVVSLGIGALVLMMLPDIKRYLKIRRM